MVVNDMEEKLLLLASPKGTDHLSVREVLDSRKVLKSRFHPSPTMQVRFADGKVVAMNRRERRHNHLYGDRLKRVSK